MAKASGYEIRISEQWESREGFWFAEDTYGNLAIGETAEEAVTNLRIEFWNRSWNTG